MISTRRGRFLKMSSRKTLAQYWTEFKEQHIKTGLMQNVKRQQLAKTRHTKGCNKENIFRRQRRNTELQEVREKHKQKKIFIECGLEDFECLKSNNESKSFYQKLNESRKDFQPRKICVEIKKECF